MNPLNVAIVGCGFVADLYLRTLPQHLNLKLLGATDHDAARLAQFAKFHDIHTYGSLGDLLADSRVEAVLNLTNPKSHFEVSRACLLAGKHVYSEKPLAMNLGDARALVFLAEQQSLQLSSAPSNLLGETAQTLWKALRENVVGDVRVVYAEMDDGMIHQMAYKNWASDSGAPWPHKDEFEVGCTMEHAGYYIGWLAAFFGPAESVTAFSSCQVMDKDTAVDRQLQGPDFSVACIRFRSGVVARLTCSIVAPHDHRLRIVGDKGVLCTEDCWNFRSPVYLRRMMRIRRRTFMNPWKRRIPLLRSPNPGAGRWGAARMDFCAGVTELARSIRERRPSRLSAEFCLHVNELVLAIQNAGTRGETYRVTTDFDPVEPMEWANRENKTVTPTTAAGAVAPYGVSNAPVATADGTGYEGEIA